MLGYLGPHLSHDPILFAKIIRLGKGFMKEVKKQTKTKTLDFNITASSPHPNLILPPLCLLAPNWLQGRCQRQNGMYTTYDFDCDCMTIL